MKRAMYDISLVYATPDGSKEIPLDYGRISFGRGSEAAIRFPDDGLSRLHATVYRDADRVWIVDENSSNGTFVNGQRISGSGTPLGNGDTIRIGHTTDLRVRFVERAAEAVPVPTAAAPQAEAAAPPVSFNLLPVALVAGAILLVSLSAVFIAFQVIGSGQTQLVRNDVPDDLDDDPLPRKSSTPESDGTPTNSQSSPSGPAGSDPGNSITPAEPAGNGAAPALLPPGKKYLDLSDTERRQYLANRAMFTAQIIGNRSSDAIPAAAIDKIKSFVDAYAKRVSVKPLSGCRFGDNLQATYERASKNAPFIIRAFNEKGTDPRIGLYLAMIESEHCVCLQSPTGPLGMFQFTYATAKLHFTPSDGVIKGASPNSPDDRCKPEPAARAAASYMKALTGRYGTGPASVPLAIGSYNSGEGGLSSNLQKALDSDTGLPRDFWTLIANGEKLSKQFQAENFKYVPKFFAAAIIGENPQDFGLTLQPLSTYSK
jgi:hypothetical protein